jgi:AcrR family transcriptional regulator
MGCITLPYINGIETKHLIKRVAAELFFEQGYRDTTIRQISDRTETNIGLIKYYFGGKLEVAHEIYGDIRRGFAELIDQDDIRPNTSDFFLLSSAIELYLCLENKNFGRFYYELSSEPSVRNKIQSHIAKALLDYAGKSNTSDYYTVLACTSLSAIKPAIVSYAINCPEDKKIPTDEYLLYYLRQQIHFLSEDPTRADELILILKSYYIEVAKNFTPVMVKLII